jgi:hypothetical protein
MRHRGFARIGLQACSFDRSSAKRSDSLRLARDRHDDEMRAPKKCGAVGWVRDEVGLGAPGKGAFVMPR